jgi:FkbM family methyltransferase
MKAIRKLLFKLLGLKGFIRLISKIYLIMVNNGMGKKKYPELFYLNELVSPGDTCIDIGANVGYYSRRLSKLVGNNGKVYAVEPIPLFGEIWKKNVKLNKNPHLTLFPYALGSENTTVKMGIPERNGVLHHGMTKIASTGDENYIKFYDVEMKIPDEIFADIADLKFVKCDVEGYENMVFSNMKETLKKHRPLVQSELGGEENRLSVIALFKELNYTPKVLKDGKLIDIQEKDYMKVNTDYYFLPV